MSDQNKAVVRRWFEEVWNQGRREAIAEILAPEAVLDECGEESVGPAGFYPYFDRMHAAFSNIHVTFHDAIAEDDIVCLRWSFTARHTGAGLGVAATGKEVHMTGITIVRIVGGKFVAGWQNWDMLGLMQQIRGERMALTYVAGRAESAAP